MAASVREPQRIQHWNKQQPAKRPRVLQYRAMINCSSKAHQKLLVAALLICNWSCFYCSSIILFLDHIEGKNSYVGRILIEYEICVLLCRYIPYTPYINQDVRPRGLASALRPEIAASASRVQASASRVQASASRVQASASRVQASASRVQASSFVAWLVSNCKF